MKPELVTTAVACSWTPLFAAVWFSRHDLHRNRLDLDSDRALAGERSRSERSWRRARRLKPGNDGEPTHTVTSSTGDPTQVSTSDETMTDETETVRDAGSGNGNGNGNGNEWFEVDLFPPTTPRTGSRFDETTAHPVDTPQRLAAIVRAVDLRLRALPDLMDLNHRTVTFRTRLHQVRQEAEQAQARLADGSYGTCLTCAGPISFVRLAERPSARLCIYCELDL